MLYQVEIKGTHKARNKEVALTFVTEAFGEIGAIEKIKEWFDLSGIYRIGRSFRAWPSDTQAFLIKTEWNEK